MCHILQEHSIIMDQQNVGSKRTTSSSSKIASKSHETAEEWKDAVVGQVNRARDGALSAKTHTSESIHRVASQLTSMSESLREQDPMLAGLAERAGRGIEGVARYVNEATPQSFIRDTERLARRQPALFYGAAALIGLAAGRFIKSTRPQGDGFESNYELGDERNGVQRRDRDSGFFPPGSERNTRSNQRFQENYDAAFDRSSASEPLGGQRDNLTNPAPSGAMGAATDLGADTQRKGKVS